MRAAALFTVLAALSAGSPAAAQVLDAPAPSDAAPRGLRVPALKIGNTEWYAAPVDHRHDDASEGACDRLLGPAAKVSLPDQQKQQRGRGKRGGSNQP